MARGVFHPASVCGVVSAGCCVLCVCFPAAAHFDAESNIAVNAKGPLSNCLLLIMMMRVPLFRRGGVVLNVECKFLGLVFSGPGVFNVIYCVLLTGRLTA